MVAQQELDVPTRGRGSYEITAEIASLVRSAGLAVGLCNVFIRHTSASLILCENADSDVRRDLETFMARLVPDGDPGFVHDSEGDDDMPAHVRSVLTSSSVTIPVAGGRLALGSWQGLYLWEHRTAPHRRSVLVTLYGER
ncbi:MAG: YjbQ family protein [Gammaproteobacteria bacterium]|nr:YjbQ family protein [Gammaproteobacteria bacterium]